jgi:hypothetical protein
MLLYTELIFLNSIPVGYNDYVTHSFETKQTAIQTNL